MKKITVITGHCGSGKTNLAVNLAVSQAERGGKAAVVDLDTVNPYFRTADFKELFDKLGIRLAAPEYANTNLDIPSLQFDIAQLAKNDGLLIIDVGGDDAGAFALGRFSQELLQHGDELEMLYVVNQKRYLTSDADEAVKLMYEIENAARIKHTAIVNNTNLGCETTLETVGQSIAFAQEISERTGLPLLFTACDERIAALLQIEKIYPIKVYVKPLWEK